MLFEVKNKRPNGKAISVVNLSEKTLCIGRTKLEPGISTPVESKVMLRKSSYVDRLWRNGVIELGATTDMIPKKESSVAGSDEEVTPLAADEATASVDSSQEKNTSPSDTKEDEADKVEDTKVEETPPEVTPVEEPEVEETPEPAEDEKTEEPVKTEDPVVPAPTEATPAKRPKGRKS